MRKQLTTYVSMHVLASMMHALMFCSGHLHFVFIIAFADSGGLLHYMFLIVFEALAAAESGE